MTNIPFHDIIGQDQAKRSILCHLVDPKIGGCLLIGPPGCGKTSLARAAADLLTDGAFVDLPLGCSEERLLGGIDPMAAMEHEQLRWRDGLLSQAHQGVCYVDEVNLLPDQLTDHLLDVAACGRLLVERDGHSIDADCRFVLIGSMNPEEGSLRPQLADRFAHHIDLDGVPSRDERQRMLMRHIQAEQGSLVASDALREQISSARAAVEQIETSPDVLDYISRRCDACALSGHRRSLAVWRTARALAALDGLNQLTIAVCEEAWKLCARQDDPEPEQGAESPPPPPAASDNEQHGGGQPGRSNTSPSSSAQQSTANGAAEPQHPSGSRSTLQAVTPSAAAVCSLPQPAAPSASLDLPQSVWRRAVARKLQRPLRWIWRQSPRPECWHLVDASRSTARHGGLAFAQERLAKFLKHPAWPRQHLVHLFGGAIQVHRRVGPQAAASLHAGSGASPLALTLEQLAQRVRRRHGSGERRVEIHSDGLLTPQPGEHIAEARQRCREALRRLSRAASVLWYLPDLPPRLAAWTTGLLRGLPITVIQHRPSA